LAISEEAGDYLDRVTPEIESALLVLKHKYDTRALVAVMARDVAEMYQGLRAAGIPGYDEFTLKRIFKYLEGIAQSAPEKPPLVIEEDTSNNDKTH
jgi:hypothetical protein